MGVILPKSVVDSIFETNKKEHIRLLDFKNELDDLLKKYNVKTSVNDLDTKYFDRYSILNIILYIEN